MVAYGPKHVNILRNMLARHVQMDHRLVCVTDDASGLDPRIEVVPLWDKCRNLGGCYNRLWVFSEEAGELFGPRFCCIDLDCVIVGDCTKLFSRPDPFIINSYNPINSRSPNQRYNGSLILMEAGARASVWDQFNPQSSPDEAQSNPDTVGSDQAWIRHHLGPHESRFTNADGIYEARQTHLEPPKNAKIIFFSGPRDPSKLKLPWVVKNWK